jgi:hypothetical protein
MTARGRPRQIVDARPEPQFTLVTSLYLAALILHQQ